MLVDSSIRPEYLRDVLVIVVAGLVHEKIGVIFEVVEFADPLQHTFNH